MPIITTFRNCYMMHLATSPVTLCVEDTVCHTPMQGHGPVMARVATHNAQERDGETLSFAVGLGEN